MDREESYRLGLAAYHAGRHEKAITMLTPLAQDSADRPRALMSRYYIGQAHYRLGVRRFEQQCYLEAARHFQAAAGFNASGGGFARFLVACHVGNRRFDLAARQLEALLEQNPASLDLRIKLALAQYKAGSRLEAMTTLREGLCLRADQAELHYQLGVLLAAEDDLAEAERCFEKAILFDESHAAARHRLAQVCAATGRADRAREELEAAHRLDPFNPRIAMDLSLAAAAPDADRRRGIALAVPAAPPALDREAIEHLGRIVVAEPDFVEAFLSLPESDVDAEVLATLAATLECALENYPEFADLHYHCGAVYRRLGRRLDAIEHTERAVEINPRYVGALIQLAALYGQTDQWGMGVERIEQAIAAGGDYPDVHVLLGDLCLAGGQTGRARRAFQRALELNDRYDAARGRLAALSA